MFFLKVGVCANLGRNMAVGVHDTVKCTAKIPNLGRQVFQKVHGSCNGYSRIPDEVSKV